MNQPSDDRNPAANPAEQDDLLQPEEAFWTRYSPHHEFPLSTVSAVVLCGLGFGLLVLVAFWQSLERHNPANRPPDMNVVEIAGGGGVDGPGSRGAGPQAKGTDERSENVTPSPTTKREIVKKEGPAPALKAPEKVANLKVDQTPQIPETTKDEAIFDAIKVVAEKQVAESMGLGASGPAGKEGLKNPGRGGGTEDGQGTGIGKKTGPGGGTADRGVLRTKRQRREYRWKINFSGTGEQHLEKLRALGITLAIPTHQRGIFLLMDLSRTPPTGRPDNLSQFADKIKWYNTSPPSLRELIRALHLRKAPNFVVIFLPEAMEEEMIRLEHDYKGLEEHQIERTDFEIRRRDDGTLGPVVVAQQPKRF